MRKQTAEDLLDAAHVDQALNNCSQRLQSLVIRHARDTGDLLATGADEHAERLEQRRKTLSNLRRKIADLNKILEPLAGTLD